MMAANIPSSKSTSIIVSIPEHHLIKVLRVEAVVNETAQSPALNNFSKDTYGWSTKWNRTIPLRKATNMTPHSILLFIMLRNYIEWPNSKQWPTGKWWEQLMKEIPA